MTRTILTFVAVLCLHVLPVQACVVPDAECVEVEEDLAVVSDVSHVFVAAGLAQARSQFEQTFRVTPAPAVVVEGSARYNAYQDVLTAAGYQVQLPWIEQDAQAARNAAVIREQVLAQTEGLPQAQQEEYVQQALQMAGLDEPLGPEMTAGAIAHELGHLWLLASYDWPEQVSPSEDRAYGSPAPDWFDEAAALAMENEALTSGRYAALRVLLADESGQGLVPLEQFLMMAHPSIGAINIDPSLLEGHIEEGVTGTQVIQLTGGDAQAFLEASGGQSAADFYAQSRGFVDFLAARGGGIDVLGEIANAYVHGQTFEDWLQTQTRGLPRSVAGLDDDWRRWLADEVATP